MSLKKFSLIFLVSVSISGCVSKNINHPIIGKWDNVRSEWKNGADTLSGGHKMGSIWKWEFTKDKYLICHFEAVNDDKFKYRYEVRGETLFVDDKPDYIIEKVSIDTLIVLEIKDLDFDKLNKRFFFIKVSKW